MSNQAGKGSELRKGANLSAFWDNYDLAFRKRKTVFDWQKHFGHVIKSYDGFREYNYDDLLTQEEYESGYVKCTVLWSPIIEDGHLEKFDELTTNDSLPHWKHG